MSPISRTIRQQVTDQIRDEVVAGAFPAGHALREGELAERFGVSRGPIRDAFLQLSQEGFLAYQANRGVTVRQPPASDDREFIVALRRQIECYVVQRGMDQLLSGGCAPMKVELDKLASACSSGDVAAVARCDMAFHEALLCGCGGGDFLPVWKWLCSQMLLTYTRLDDYEQVFNEHVEILANLEKGRKKAAISAIKANVR